MGIFHLHMSFPSSVSCQKSFRVYHSTGHNNGSLNFRTRSAENFNNLSKCVDNMEDDVSKLLMEFPETDFSQDSEFFQFLNDYFSTTNKVSELYQSLRNVLEKAEHDEYCLIDVALHDFEEEKLCSDGLGDAQFIKTLSDLTSFSKFYNSSYCDCEIFRKTDICHRDLADMVVKFERSMKKINKKLKRTRRVKAIVAAALIAPAIAVLLASKIVGCFDIIPTNELHTIVASKWRKATETLKQENMAMTSMERGVMLALKEVGEISRLVSKLETVERSIQVAAEFAIKKKSPLVASMEGMEKERKRLQSTLVNLRKETGKCDDFAEFSRNVAREKIVEFLSHGQKKSTRNS